MISGHKPSAYFLTFDGEGKRIEGECRQCVHCQYTWEYRPGSGVERGFCIRHGNPPVGCGGFLCARAECFQMQRWLIHFMQIHYNQTRSCVPWEEWNNRVHEKIGHLLPLAVDLTITSSGLIVPRT
jgi:hypothetical protein